MLQKFFDAENYAVRCSAPGGSAHVALLIKMKREKIIHAMLRKHRTVYKNL